MTFTPERSRAIRAELIKTATTKTARHTRPLLVAGVAVAATAVAAGFALPKLLPGSPTLAVPASRPPSPVPTVPSSDPTGEPPASPTAANSEPSALATPNANGAELAALTVATTGWKTYSSPEYPVTFAYPPDWKISYAKRTPASAKAEQLTSAGIVDGCGTNGCVVYVSPPDAGDDGPFLVLATTGFQGDHFYGGYPGVWQFVTVPGLAVWTSADPAVPPSPATIVTRSEAGFAGGTAPPEDFGPPYDYMLSTAEGVQSIAVGDLNPLAEHPEASFHFTTSNGVPDNQIGTVLTILTSVRANPAYNPTQPAKDASGRPRFWLKSMDAPQLGIDSSKWKMVSLPDGNISLRVPPKWETELSQPSFSGQVSGGLYLTAPSGYTVVALRAKQAKTGCQSESTWTPLPERLSSVSSLAAGDADGISRPVKDVDGVPRSIDLWWKDATWYPAEIWLALPLPASDQMICTQSAIDYGGEYLVSIHSADNLKNPTAKEFDQAVAILGSVARLS